MCGAAGNNQHESGRARGASVVANRVTLGHLVHREHRAVRLQCRALAKPQRCANAQAETQIGAVAFEDFQLRHIDVAGEDVQRIVAHLFGQAQDLVEVGVCRREWQMHGESVQAKPSVGRGL